LHITDDGTSHGAPESGNSAGHPPSPTEPSLVEPLAGSLLQPPAGSVQSLRKNQA